MEAIKLHDLVKEIQRSMRFFDYEIGARTFNDTFVTLKGIEVEINTEETPSETPDEENIPLLEKIDELKVFEKPASIFTPGENIRINGTVLFLEREKGFIEIDVAGIRSRKMVFASDFDTDLKNPVERDIEYVLKKYPDVREKLINEVKKLIEVKTALNPKKLANLSRLITFIRNLDRAPPGMSAEEISKKMETGRWYSDPDAPYPEEGEE